MMSWVDHPELNSVIAYFFFGCDWIFGVLMVINIVSFLFSPIQRFVVFHATKNWKKVPPNIKWMHQLKPLVLGPKSNWENQHGFYFQVFNIFAMVPIWSYFHFVRHYPDWFHPAFITKVLWLYQFGISAVPFVLGMKLVGTVQDREEKAKLVFIKKRGLE
jgi:hypothetical protein